MLNPGLVCGWEFSTGSGCFVGRFFGTRRFFFGADSAGGVMPQVSRVISCCVQHVLPSLLGNKPAGQPPVAGGCGPQAPAAIASGEQPPVAGSALGRSNCSTHAPSTQALRTGQSVSDWHTLASLPPGTQ
jgi:hypothetical protein